MERRLPPKGRIEAGVPVLMLEICRHCGDDLRVTRTGGGVYCRECDAPERVPSKPEKT
jgi:hypothetical protein